MGTPPAMWFAGGEADLASKAVSRGTGLSLSSDEEGPRRMEALPAHFCRSQCWHTLFARRCFTHSHIHSSDSFYNPASISGPILEVW